jgi:hypothetical protein
VIVASKTVDKRPAVDPHDEPSVEWGWHGTFPKAIRIAGWFSAVALLLMLHGNHHGNTENVWLVGLALLLIFGLLRDLRKQRTAWRK